VASSAGGAAEVVISGDDPGLDPGFDPPVLCDAPACVDAKSRLAEARSRYVNACDQLRRDHGFNVLIRRVVSIPIWIVVVIVVVAIILWFLGLGWLSAILWTIVIVWALLWIVLFIFVRVEVSFAEALKEAGEAFAEAVTDVIAACPEQCRGDLSIPECVLE
jgi:ABC-type transport system involved in cytochrome bd biosynthesis fused ATPase/permease subunit